VDESTDDRRQIRGSVQGCDDYKVVGTDPEAGLSLLEQKVDVGGVTYVQVGSRFQKFSNCRKA